MDVELTNSDRGVQRELTEALTRCDGRLGEVFSLWAAGMTNPTEIAAAGAAANSGAAGHSIAVIRAVLEDALPTSSTIARQCAGTIARLLRSDRCLSASAREQLTHTRDRLLAVAHSAIAQEIEERVLAGESATLEIAGRDRSGVYV